MTTERYHPMERRNLLHGHIIPGWWVVDIEAPMNWTRSGPRYVVVEDCDTRDDAERRCAELNEVV